jgi:hypothetical protein
MASVEAPDQFPIKLQLNFKHEAITRVEGQGNVFVSLKTRPYSYPNGVVEEAQLVYTGGLFVVDIQVQDQTGGLYTQHQDAEWYIRGGSPIEKYRCWKHGPADLELDLLDFEERRLDGNHEETLISGDVYRQRFRIGTEMRHCQCDTVFLRISFEDCTRGSIISHSPLQIIGRNEWEDIHGPITMQCTVQK